MFALIIVSLAGFILSLLLHFLALFSIYNPPRLINLLIRLGVFVIFLFWCFISKNMRSDASSKDFNESLWNATPKWMTTTTGLIILYALIGLFNSLAEKYSSGSLIADKSVAENSHGSFPSYWMALYAIMFTLFYSCKCLRKRTGSKE